jgi:hypothetical protein
MNKKVYKINHKFITMPVLRNKIFIEKRKTLKTDSITISINNLSINLKISKKEMNKNLQ